MAGKVTGDGTETETMGSLMVLEEDIVGVKEGMRGSAAQLSAMTMACTGKSKASELLFAFDKARMWVGRDKGQGMEVVRRGMVRDRVWESCTLEMEEGTVEVDNERRPVIKLDEGE
jgi:hypothetical protein